jgi:hypothetical protein
MAEIDELYATVQETFELAADASEGRALALRLVLSGQGDLHDTLLKEKDYIESECRSLANAIGQPGVWLQKIELSTKPPKNSQANSNFDEAIEGLLSTLQHCAENDDFHLEINKEIKSLMLKVPKEAKGKDLFDISNKDDLPHLLKEVTDLLLSQLKQEGGR